MPTQSGCRSRRGLRATSLTGAVEVKLQPGGGETADQVGESKNTKVQPVAFLDFSYAPEYNRQGGGKFGGAR